MMHSLGHVPSQDKEFPNRSADELLPRRGPRERRASGIGEHVGIPASNEHLSKGAGDVSDEAPPMLKSAVYEKNHDPCINASPPLIKSSSNGPDGGVLSSDAMFLTFEMTVAPIEMTVELPKMIWIVVAWGGEMVKRLTKAHQKMNASRDQFDKAMGQHAEVLARLEELETLRSREQEAAAAQREALEAKLVTEREAHEAEKAAREMLEAELEDVKSRAARDAERLKLEGREEFLKSSEFDTLLGKKAGGFFKTGFLGCVAQWRANGYSEDEHPAPFLNVQQAIAEMPDEEDAQEEGEDEEEEEGAVGSEATPPSSPLS
ncbi:hypothetical protein F511_36397 [Dorcoceras hygrometricum]|uniref:Uncharacterized protein n=1 Tax=Dorcoceras hygrometricum TaxID=472368 RepID=A0A2Z7B4F7_9LAMI|nr:hypothetical protein F511_36397 [Dorcoceras hygrometricum]